MRTFMGFVPSQAHETGLQRITSTGVCARRRQALLFQKSVKSPQLRLLMRIVCPPILIAVFLFACSADLPQRTCVSNADCLANEFCNSDALCEGAQGNDVSGDIADGDDSSDIELDQGTDTDESDTIVSDALDDGDSGNELDGQDADQDCIDDDNDGYGLNCLAGADCNDDDPLRYQSRTVYPDADLDGFGSGSGRDLCIGPHAPPYVADNNTDCGGDDDVHVGPQMPEIPNDGVANSCESLIELDLTTSSDAVLWVASSVTGCTSDGSQACPYETITEAITASTGNPSVRYLALGGGAYEESFVLDGLSLVGGFSRDGDSFEYDANFDVEVHGRITVQGGDPVVISQIELLQSADDTPMIFVSASGVDLTIHNVRFDVSLLATSVAIDVNTPGGVLRVLDARFQPINVETFAAIQADAATVLLSNNQLALFPGVTDVTFADVAAEEMVIDGNYWIMSAEVDAERCAGFILAGQHASVSNNILRTGCFAETVGLRLTDPELTAFVHENEFDFSLDSDGMIEVIDVSQGNMVAWNNILVAGGPPEFEGVEPIDTIGVFANTGTIVQLLNNIVYGGWGPGESTALLVNGARVWAVHNAFEGGLGQTSSIAVEVTGAAEIVLVNNTIGAALGLTDRNLSWVDGIATNHIAYAAADNPQLTVVGNLFHWNQGCDIHNGVNCYDGSVNDCDFDGCIRAEGNRMATSDVFPPYADHHNLDFHIPQSSQYHDANGTDVSVYEFNRINFDIDFEARPGEGGYDIGVDQWYE